MDINNNNMRIYNDNKFERDKDCKKLSQINNINNIDSNTVNLTKFNDNMNLNFINENRIRQFQIIADTIKRSDPRNSSFLPPSLKIKSSLDQPNNINVNEEFPYLSDLPESKMSNRTKTHFHPSEKRIERLHSIEQTQHHKYKNDLIRLENKKKEIEKAEERKLLEKLQNDNIIEDSHIKKNKTKKSWVGKFSDVPQKSKYKICKNKD